MNGNGSNPAGGQSDYHVYALGPIDWFDGWTPAVELLARLAESEYGTHSFELLIVRLIEAARLFGRYTYWEGDGVWWVAGLPTVVDDGWSEYLLAVKQSNNGSVFVWSPVLLPWLSEYENSTVVR